MGDQVVLQHGIAAQELNQIASMGHWPQLGSGRSDPQGEHALHDPLGVLQLLHRLLAKAISRLALTPELHEGGLGHVLLDGGEFQAQGAP